MSQKTVSTVNGTGNIAVNAVRKLVVHLHGTAHLGYSGNPEIEQEIEGMGTIYPIRT
jgi:hypothetical protein